MDPYHLPDDMDYPNYFYDDSYCPSDHPSTSSALPPDGPPQVHMDWLETFGPINDFDIHPCDLDDSVKDVDWDSWMRYLSNDEKKNRATQKEEPHVSPSMLVTPKEEPGTSVTLAPTSTIIASTIKDESTSVVCQKEELEDVKSVLSTCSSSTPTQSGRFAPYELKPKRGRPKKVRMPEDHDSMTTDERRKAMNRDAALRYREKKKEKQEADAHEAKELTTRNRILREQEEQLERDIKTLKVQMNAMFDFKFDF